MVGFSQETLRERLGAAGVINLDGEAAAKARAAAGAGAPGAKATGIRQSTLNDAAGDESSDFDD